MFTFNVTCLILTLLISYNRIELVVVVVEQGGTPCLLHKNNIKKQLMIFGYYSCKSEIQYLRILLLLLLLFLEYFISNLNTFLGFINSVYYSNNCSIEKSEIIGETFDANFRLSER